MTGNWDGLLIYYLHIENRFSLSIGRKHGALYTFLKGNHILFLLSGILLIDNGYQYQ